MSTATHTQDLPANIDSVPTVLELAQRDTRLHRTSHEWRGPCPMPGCTCDNDGFRVMPLKNRWACRGCCERGDSVVGYVMKRDAIGYRAACAKLGLIPGAPLPRHLEAVQEPTRDVGSPEWCAVAKAAARRAFDQLWGAVRETHSPQGRLMGRFTLPPVPAAREALRFLAGRGIREDTARTWGLGFASGDPVLLKLGPPPWPSLSVPGPGLLMPWVAGGALWQVKIRILRPRPGGPKLLHPRWTDPTRNDTCPPPCAAPHLFGADTLRGKDVAILVEGELDAVLLAQEAGDMVGVCTLGSASYSLPARALAHLLHLRRILLAYDSDDEGRRGASRLQARWPLLPLERIELPPGPWKDATDFHRAGGNLRTWVRYHLADTTTKQKGE